MPWLTIHTASGCPGEMEACVPPRATGKDDTASRKAPGGATAGTTYGARLMVVARSGRGRPVRPSGVPTTAKSVTPGVTPGWASQRVMREREAAAEELGKTPGKLRERICSVGAGSGLAAERRRDAHTGAGSLVGRER